MEPIDVDALEVFVAEALATIPNELRAEMENVAIIIDDESPPGPLYGLYEGIPLTRRGPMSYGGVMPDRITLYQDTISAHCHNEAELIAQIRKTVIHEIAHHFGIGDPRLKELGWS